MGTSTRISRPRPQPRAPKIQDAAVSARAHGLLTEAALGRMTDGKVSANDVRTAEKILAKTEELLGEIQGTDGAKASHVRIAEERVEVAQTLLDAVQDQLDKPPAPRRPTRPSRPSSKK